MRLTIHIGTYKTASSSIQWVLSHNADRLAAEGIGYATTGLHGRMSKHLHLFDRVVDNEHNHQRHLEVRGNDYLAALREECAGPLEHLIISEEELSYPSPLIAEYLAPLADVAEVEIVMVARRPPEFLESLYLQFLTEPHRAIQQSFVEFIEDDLHSLRCDYPALLAPWVAAFGSDAVWVLDFDEIKADPIGGFLRHLGLPADLDRPGRKINESITAVAGEVLRTLGTVAPQIPRRDLVTNLKATAPGKGTTQITDEIDRAIMERYAESMQRLADDFGVDLATNSPSGRRQLSSAELSAEALESVGALFGQVWERSQDARLHAHQARHRSNKALNGLKALLSADDSR